jgi:uncharacterized protein
MSNDPKLDAVARFFTAYAEGDAEGIATVLADDVAWTIPGHHPLSGTKHGRDEVLSFFDQLSKTGFQAEPILLAANDEYVVDVHRGWSTQGVG